MTSRLIPIALAAALGACAAGGYEYQPITASASVGGLPAARYVIPPAAPTGQIQVTSTGISDLRGSGNVLPAIHVRMVADNQDGGQPWQIQVGDARLRIGHWYETTPMFINTPLDGPAVVVGPYERRVVDFYFPLPRSYTNEGMLSGFDFSWMVDVPGQHVRGDTHFTRVST